MTQPFRSNVRYIDGEFHLRCETCKVSNQGSAYWPMALEFWNPTLGFQKCRACHEAYRRLHPHHSQEFLRLRQKRYYLKHRERRRAYASAYYRAHKESMNAASRARYAARRDRQKEAA